MSKKIKIKERYFIEIPKDLALHLPDDVEITSVKDGVVLITGPSPPSGLLTAEKNPLLQPKPGQAQGRPTARSTTSPPLSKDELELLKKIEKIRFSERSPNKVERMITKKENEILQSLIDKGIVTVYKGKNYAQLGGVYSISSGAFSQTHGGAAGAGYAEVPGIPEYLVIEDENAAKRFSETYEAQLRGGKLVGIRGFDRKYYVISTAHLEQKTPLILKQLEKSSETPDSLSEKLSIPFGACMAILLILAEHGEVYQSTDKKYHLV